MPCIVTLAMHITIFANCAGSCEAWVIASYATALVTTCVMLFIEAGTK